MSCDIIIPVWNQLELTKECIDSIVQYTTLPYRLIIIDNGNNDQCRDYLERLSKENKASVTLIRNKENLGFVKAVNQGLNASSANYACLLNNDTRVENGWLEELIDVANKNPRIGIVNPRCNKVKNDSSKGQWFEIGFATGFCMLIKKEVIQKIGLLDENYGMGYWEDTDYCQRAKNAGYVCALAKAAYVYHHAHKTFNLFNKRMTNELFEKNKEYFYSKWGKILRIACVIFERNITDSQKDSILSLASKGHMIHLFLKKSILVKADIKHGNIRELKYPDIFFKLFTTIKIWQRQKKKKKFDKLLTNNPEFAKRMKLLAPGLIIEGI